MVEFVGHGSLGPLVAGTVLDGWVKPGVSRRDTSPAHFWRACTFFSKPMRPFGFDLVADGV